MKNSVYIVERHWNIHLNKQMKKGCIECAPPVALNWKRDKDSAQNVELRFPDNREKELKKCIAANVENK